MVRTLKSTWVAGVGKIPKKWTSLLYLSISAVRDIAGLMWREGPQEWEEEERGKEDLLFNQILL